MVKPILYVCFSLLFVALSACGGILFWIRSQTRYDVEAYKPVQFVERGDQQALRRRLTQFPLHDCVLMLEWYTYDNADITRGPYKLFVVLEPSSDTVQSVDIVQATVTSSLGREYRLVPGARWPVTLTSAGRYQRSAHKFEPALPFDFHGGEVIHTDLVVRINTSEGSREERIRVEWQPVVVRHWSSLV